MFLLYLLVYFIAPKDGALFVICPCFSYFLVLLLFQLFVWRYYSPLVVSFFWLGPTMCNRRLSGKWPALTSSLGNGLGVVYFRAFNKESLWLGHHGKLIFKFSFNNLETSDYVICLSCSTFILFKTYDQLLNLYFPLLYNYRMIIVWVRITLS
jgi:hypothetical protein